MNYIVVLGETPSTLASEVNKQLKLGYKMQGGICATKYGFGTTFFQSMYIERKQ